MGSLWLIQHVSTIQHNAHTLQSCKYHFSKYIIESPKMNLSPIFSDELNTWMTFKRKSKDLRERNIELKREIAHLKASILKRKKFTSGLAFQWLSAFWIPTIFLFPKQWDSIKDKFYILYEKDHINHTKIFTNVILRNNIS